MEKICTNKEIAIYPKCALNLQAYKLDTAKTFRRDLHFYRRDLGHLVG